MLSLIFAGASATPRIYIVVGKSSEWAEPSAADVKAGILAGGAVWSGSANAPSVSGAFDVGAMATGLQSGVKYTAALVWSDGTLDSNVYIVEFTTDKKTGASASASSSASSAAASSYEEDHAHMIEREEREAEEIMMIVATLVQRGALHA